MELTLTLVLSILPVFYIGLSLLLYLTQDPQEPPVVDTILPFLSPMLGMIRKKTKYYVELRNQYNYPIYTLRLPRSRLYIINSPALISAAQCAHRALSFAPLAVEGAISVSRYSTSTSRIVGLNANGAEGEWGFAPTFYKAIHPPLMPGPGLDGMNRAMLGVVAETFSELKEKVEMRGRCKVRLYEWIRGAVTRATSDAVYGVGNPYRDAIVEAAFWNFVPSIMLLILNVPSWTLKDALNSHDHATAAFEDYFRSGLHQFSSTLTQARYAHSLAHKIPLRDIAKSEVGNGVALFANTAPTTFWLLFYIYSNPAILRDCRHELESVIDVSTSPPSNPGEGLRKTYTLEMCKVKTTCPLLVSTLQETLRTISTSVSARLVMQDHFLDGKYLLKKGSVVMMPSPVQHLDPAIWGSDIHKFKHHRFTNSSRAQAAAFRGFGGGTTLCPGRHFASTEILAFVASMILQFDVRPTQWQGWKAPSVQKVAMWEATPAPDTDFEVEISKREGGGDGDWVFVLSESDKPIGMSVEDLTSSKVED